MLSGWRALKSVRCGDGRTVHVYRRADEAFPVVASTLQVTFDSTLDAVGQLQVSAHGAVERKLTELATQLDGVNRSLRERFRAAYVAYQADPCNNGEYLTTEIRRISRQEERLREAAIAMETLRLLAAGGGSQDHILGALRQITAFLLGEAPPQPELTPQLVEERGEAWQGKEVSDRD